MIVSNRLTFVKSFKSFTLDSGEMYEYIVSVFACDEAIALLCD